MKAFTVFGLTSMAFQACLAAEPNIAALRTIMTDSRFVGLVSPCTVGGTTRTTAAEWLRTAFHDAGSYDAQAGTGGIDGSIAFETTRAENFGPFLTATINQYKTFQQEGVSLADLVVLGAITAVGACGGPAIPFHAGRIDAASPAEEGRLPLPEETTETHLQKFARMGFSPEEMVTLVACGHSIGGVHGPNTPLVTSERIKPFDSSRIVFDNVVAKEYVNGSTVNPLGQPFDVTRPNDLTNLARSSDSRTFAVDGNATIKRYAASQDAFFTDCVASFSKMFDQAVPAGTQLTAAISPFAVNIGALITLRNEKLNLQSGSARLYGMTGKYSRVSLTYTNRDGSPGSNPNMIFARAPRTISNGQSIDLVDFSTRTAVDPVAGIYFVKTVITFNDGSIYSSPEGTENLRVDDTILIDQGAAFTCKHDNGGINVTIAVLGPYNRADKVEVIWDKVSDPTRTTMGAPILADYRRQRPDTPFIYYGVFIPSAVASDIANFGARLTRANGEVFQDTKQGVMYRASALDDCVAGTEIPLPGPRPTGGITTRAIRTTCPVRGQTRCRNDCVDTRSNIFHCGGCSFAGGQDCSELGDDVECVQGRCIVSESDV